MIKNAILILIVFCNVLLNGQSKTNDSKTIDCTKTKLEKANLVADLMPDIQDYYDSLRINVGVTIDNKFLQAESRGRVLNDSVKVILKGVSGGSKIYFDLTYQDLRDANKTRYSKTYVLRVTGP